MHAFRHPRNAILVGLLFAFLGAVFWALPTFGGWHVDYAGVTLLVGVVGSIVGGVIAHAIGTGDLWELNFLGSVIAIVTAALLIALLDPPNGRRRRRRRHSGRRRSWSRSRSRL